MNKVVKIISIVLMVILIASISVPVFALNVDPNLVTGNINTTTNIANKTKDITGTIIGVVQIIGIAVAIIMLIVLAIKYLSSSAADKAEIKKHAVVYIVGAICLFGAAGILQLIKTFADQINA